LVKPRAKGGGVIVSLVFASGFAGLVYQVLWMKQIGLLFGSTSQAAAVTLAAFFAGDVDYTSHHFVRFVDFALETRERPPSDLLCLVSSSLASCSKIHALTPRIRPLRVFHVRRQQ
jgi:hypothetical protein